MRSTSINSQGQALVELLLSSTLVMLCIAGSGWLFKLEWDRARCAYVVFEKTHAKVVGASDPEPRVFVALEESEAGVSGSARCGQAREEVSLPHLEQAVWH